MALATAPAAAGSTSFYLNSYNATDASSAFCSGTRMLSTISPAGCGTAITAPLVFANGTMYSVMVLGAVSAWGEWPFRRCGEPEPASQFASPGHANRPAGDDAQFRFAMPLYKGSCAALPKKSSYFQVNLGSGWMHPVASDDPTSPAEDVEGAQHPYTFSMTGQGLAPQFRFIDYYASDNSGQFKITVGP